jgi:hypothetical protein
MRSSCKATTTVIRGQYESQLFEIAHEPLARYRRIDQLTDASA